MRKRFVRILSIILVLALLMGGCTQNTGTNPNGTTSASTTASPVEISKDASLSVYIFTGGNTTQKCYVDDAYEFADDYKAVIDMTITEFTDAEEMKSRLQTELAVGQGPDIIMADVDFGLDMMALAKNGAFYDMTDIIAADESFNNDKYYLSVMEAGQIADRQYVIPLSFTLPAFVTTADALGQMGIDLETDTTMKVYEKMLVHLKASDTPQVSGIGGYWDTILALMLSCGKTPVSYETGEVDLDGAENRMLMELGAELFIDWNNWLKAVRGSANASEQISKVPLTYVNTMVSPDQLQVYHSTRVEADSSAEVKLFFAPDAEGNHHALVQEFAAVSANAKNPALAWLFLREIIDHTTVMNRYTALSLNRGVTLGWIRSTMSVSREDRYGFMLEKLPKESSDQMLNACETITGACIYQSSPLTMIFTNSIIAYRDGAVTFDEMVDDIQNKVKLYINE